MAPGRLTGRGAASHTRWRWHLALSCQPPAPTVSAAGPAFQNRCVAREGRVATYSTIGQPVPRIEGPDKVTGATRYAADVLLPGTLWCKVLRSPLPHARIVRIDTRRAAALPGVRAVLTGADLPPDTRVGRRMR